MYKNMPTKVINSQINQEIKMDQQHLPNEQLIKNLPSEQFMKKYLEKSLLFPPKLDKKNVQKELVNRYRFKTQVCNDTSYLAIIEAEKSIDRKN